MMRVFRDRHDAGTQLACALRRHADAADVIVLAHSRSSVPVAYEVATRLALPLHLIACEDTDAGDALHEVAIELAGRTVIVVDDGAHARELPVAVDRIRRHGAASVIAASAVVSPQVLAVLQAVADDVCCVLTPQHIYSIAAWYADLTEPSAEDIRDLLVAAARSQLSVIRGNFLINRVDS